MTDLQTKLAEINTRREIILDFGVMRHNILDKEKTGGEFAVVIKQQTDTKMRASLDDVVTALKGGIYDQMMEYISDHGQGRNYTYESIGEEQTNGHRIIMVRWGS